MLKVVLVSAFVLVVASGAFAEKTDYLKSNLDKAKMSYVETVSSAKEKLTKAYDIAIKGYTQKGQLDDAIALKKEKGDFSDDPEGFFANVDLAESREVKITINATRMESVLKYCDTSGGVGMKNYSLHLFDSGSITTKDQFGGDFKLSISGHFDRGEVIVCGQTLNLWRTRIGKGVKSYSIQRIADRLILKAGKKKKLVETKQIQKDHLDKPTTIKILDKGWKQYGSAIKVITIIGKRIKHID